MITPKQFKAQASTGSTLYTVTANQKGIVKGLSISNASSTPCTFTLTVFGVVVYTTRTLGPLETFECAAAINKIGLAADTIVFTSTANVNVLGSVLEVAAT